MPYKQPPLQPDEQTARSIFDRNITNSMAVNSGAFEEVLADIITQLESPPKIGDRYLTAWDMARRIAEAMTEGFAGLPPNGFDFACWLWEAAPLHVVEIPQANSIGISHGYRYGVIHLRKIAAMIAGHYVQQQPQKASVVIELIDMSVDWVDARNLINYAMIDYYTQHFVLEYQNLQELLDHPRVWRKLIPLGVAARIVGTQPSLTPSAFDLVAGACGYMDDERVYDAMRYVLRVGGLYGDQKSVLAFLSSLRTSTQKEVRGLVCDFIRNPKLRWDHVSREDVTSMLLSWKNGSDATLENSCIDAALQRLVVAKAG
ncbi:hypothetical protein KQI65_03155 [bacterium]|nr:hypothetical protein [bacterium]